MNNKFFQVKRMKKRKKYFFSKVERTNKQKIIFQSCRTAAQVFVRVRRPHYTLLSVPIFKTIYLKVGTQFFVKWKNFVGKIFTSELSMVYFAYKMHVKKFIETKYIDFLHVFMKILYIRNQYTRNLNTKRHHWKITGENFSDEFFFS